MTISSSSALRLAAASDPARIGTTAMPSMSQKVEDVTTPLEKSQQRDLRPVLMQMERHPLRTKTERDERARTLAGIHDSLGLQSDPVALG